MSKTSSNIVYKLINIGRLFSSERVFYASSDFEALTKIKYPRNGVLLRSNDGGVFYPFIIARFLNGENIDEVENV